jgi:TolB-like protein/DNA-binding winged helix-turn-helix (wHTH) protein/Tfp pilus assembly protein PilF
MTITPHDMQGIDSEVFLVGDLLVDIGQQRITRAGIEITLPNLSFQLLVALIRAAPNVLSHDLLMARVWPGIIVSPETVTKRVNLLREALGDDAQEPRYIAGVRSRGYQLVATVSREVRPAAPAEAPASTPSVLGQPDGVTAPGTVMNDTGTATQRTKWVRWLVPPFLVAAIFAIAVGERTAHRDSAVDAHLTTKNSAAATAAIGARARTVAVMPFDSISADPADAYLAQGLPEMILNRLSRISGLSVIARNSSFALTTKSIDSREIGRRLNSGYLINGSVQRETDRLRVAVQLVDTAAGTQVWSAHFDRALRDIFNVEDEIADQVADALSVRLGGSEPTPVHGERSSNIEAYLAFLHGRTLLGRFTVAESDAAIPYFEKATTLDPHFAAAFASLYDAHLQADERRHEDLTAVRQRYRPLIDRALAIDPNSGSAYIARAMWEDAPNEARDADFRRGVALDPSNGRGLTAYAAFLDWTYHRPEEATRMLQRALWIDPMSPWAHYHAASRSLDEGGARIAEQKVLEVLQLDPDFVPALELYGLYLWLFHGRLTDAIQVLEHAIRLDPGNPSLRHNAMAIYLDLEDEPAAREVSAGTPQSARAVGLLSMYRGDWRAAARAAYDEAGWTYDYCQNWLAAEALRDDALKTGKLSRAISFIRVKYQLGDNPAAHLDTCNYNATIVLSQLLAASGQAQQATELRRAAAVWGDANWAKYLGNVRLQHANVMLLDGKTDAALAELAASFRFGLYKTWWYFIDYDPLWSPLHGDPRFQAIAADVRRYVDTQRGQLEALRQHGDVPRRGQPTAPH